MEWIFEFFKKLKQVLTDEVIQRIDTRKGVSLGINSGVSLRLKRARGSGELYVVMRSVIGDYNDHHFTKHEFIQFSNAVETILNSLKHRRVSSAIGEAVEEQPDHDAGARRHSHPRIRQATEEVRPNAKENGQIRQSNTARTLGNVGSHRPSRIWASSQFRKRLPSMSVPGSSGESRTRPPARAISCRY